VKRLAAALVLLLSPSVHAYVQTRTLVGGTAIHWEQSCVVVQPDVRGDTADAPVVELSDINDALTNAVGHWNGQDGTCTYMRLGVVPGYQVLDAVADSRPAVVFRSDTWPHDKSIIALTTVWFANRPNTAADGLISDADIELNAVGFSFTTDVASTQPRIGTQLQDLENTLTHELGHVLGLAHTCWDHVLDSPPLDNNGNPAPDCNDANLPAVVLNATMYPYATPGSTSMRVLSADDVSGICDNDSSMTTPSACYGDIVAPGCSVAPRAPTSRAPWLLFLAPLVAVLLGRRARHGSL
jgi:hypothetical protein